MPNIYEHIASTQIMKHKLAELTFILREKCKQ